MIDEAMEELAAAYALGLLEGDEAATLAEQLEQNPELRHLVDELRENGCANRAGRAASAASGSS